MIVLSGAEVVLPGGLLSPGTVIIEGSRIVDVSSGTRAADPVNEHLDLAGRYLVPGFIDVHVHGVEGVDTLEGEDPIAEMSRRMPRHGVTAFCPTSIACDPSTLATMLADTAGAFDRCRGRRPGTAGTSREQLHQS